jgi:SAM-dependent methyltransferase
MLPLDRQNQFRQRLKALRPGWRPSGEILEGWVRERLSPQARVLDLGCGRGGVMELFWTSVQCSVGADADLSSLRENRAGMPTVATLADDLPFLDGSFDLVLALWLAEHLADPARVLAEVRRVLAPGGRVIVLTPNRLHPLLRFNQLSRAWPDLQRRLVPALYGRADADTFRVYYRANTADEWRGLSARAGLRIARFQVVSDPTYLAFGPALFRIAVWFDDILPQAWGVHLLVELERP